MSDGPGEVEKIYYETVVSLEALLLKGGLPTKEVTRAKKELRRMRAHLITLRERREVVPGD